MQEIVRRVWKEPAVAIGLVTSVALAIIVVVSGDAWNVSTIAGVVAPLGSALGIRTQVTPTGGKTKDAAPAPVAEPAPALAAAPDPQTPPPADHDESEITPGDPTV
jgi:hypothetical protein